LKNTIPLILLTVFFSLSCSEREKEFTIWIGGAPSEIAFWEEVINDYKLTTGIPVQLVRQPTYSDQRRQALVISLESEQPNPDLFLMDVIWVKQFVESEWLQPLDGYMNPDTFSTNVFFERIIEQVNKFDDTIYALPVFLDVGLLYYRKDLLSEYGYEKPPETWNKLLEISLNIIEAEKKRNNFINGFVWQGAQYEGLVCTFNEFISSNRGSILENNQLKINQQPNIEALNFMQDIIQRYSISPRNIYTEMKEEEVRRSFQTGNSVFERNWSYAWQLHQSAGSPVAGKTGITILPHFENGKPAATLGGWHIGLSKFSDAKEEAWELMKFITSYEVQKRMLMEIGWNPSRKDVYDDPDAEKEIPHIHILKNSLENSDARPTLSFYPQLSQIIQRFVNNCIAGRMPPEEALNMIQNEGEQLMRLYSND
jgi:multiple sugar transport system substrate-binding protein